MVGSLHHGKSVSKNRVPSITSCAPLCTVSLKWSAYEDCDVMKLPIYYKQVDDYPLPCDLLTPTTRVVRVCVCVYVCVVCVCCVCVCVCVLYAYLYLHA